MAYRGWAIMILMFLVFVMGLAVLNTVKLANTPVTAFEAPTPLPTVQLPGMAPPALKMVTDQTFGRGMMLGDTFIQCAKVVGPVSVPKAPSYADIPVTIVAWPVEMPEAQRPVGAVQVAPGVDPQADHWKKGVGGVDMSYPADWPQMSREDQNHWLATRDARLEALNK